MPTEALLLSPHGHVEHALYLVDDGQAVWAHVEPGTAGALVEFLDRMRFWSKVEVEDVSTSYAVVLTPHGDRAASPACRCGRRPTASRRSWPATTCASVLAGPVAGVWALEALRIADGRPRLGLETDHRTIPHELGWLETAVHLDKGCYRGQETVARVHNLGRPPRRLVLLHLDGSESVLPEHGEPVLLGDRTVGTVTSAARHYELGPIALALVKRSTPAEETLVDRRHRRRPGGRSSPPDPRPAEAASTTCMARRRPRLTRRRPRMAGGRYLARCLASQGTCRPRKAAAGQVSRIRVTGPSLTSASCMSAPNTPGLDVRTAGPQGGDQVLDQRLGDRAGCGRVPGGAAALAGVAVQRELADHQQRRARLRCRLLAGEDPQLVHLGGHPLGGRLGVVMA